MLSLIQILASRSAHCRDACLRFNLLSTLPVHAQYSESIQIPSRLPSVSQNPFEFWVFRQMRILSYGQLAAIVWKFSQNSQRVRIAVPLLDQILLFALAYCIHRPRVLEGKLYQMTVSNLNLAIDLQTEMKARIILVSSLAPRHRATSHHQPESGADPDPTQRDSLHHSCPRLTGSLTR